MTIRYSNPRTRTATPSRRTPRRVRIAARSATVPSRSSSAVHLLDLVCLLAGTTTARLYVAMDSLESLTAGPVALQLVGHEQGVLPRLQRMFAPVTVVASCRHRPLALWSSPTLIALPFGHAHRVAVAVSCHGHVYFHLTTSPRALPERQPRTEPPGTRAAGSSDHEPAVGRLALPCLLSPRHEVGAVAFGSARIAMVSPRSDWIVPRAVAAELTVWSHPWHRLPPLVRGNVPPMHQRSRTIYDALPPDLTVD